MGLRGKWTGEAKIRVGIAGGVSKGAIFSKARSVGCIRRTSHDGRLAEIAKILIGRPGAVRTEGAKAAPEGQLTPDACPRGANLTPDKDASSRCIAQITRHSARAVRQIHARGCIFDR